MECLGLGLGLVWVIGYIDFGLVVLGERETDLTALLLNLPAHYDEIDTRRRTTTTTTTSRTTSSTNYYSTT